MARTQPGHGWFRIRHALISHPRVIRIAEALGAEGDTDALSLDDRINLAIGALCRVWSWGNTHADRDGRILYATVDTVDVIAHIAKFSEALIAVGWLTVDDDGVVLSNFNEHNDPLYRPPPAAPILPEEEDEPDDMTPSTVSVGISVHDTGADTSIEEQEREPEREIFSLSTEEPEEAKPKRTTKDDAEEVYRAYPRKVAKVQAMKRILAVLKEGYPVAELIRRTRAFAETQPPAGHPDQKFTPYPATWYNQRRFEDAEFDEGRSDDANVFDVPPEDGEL